MIPWLALALGALVQDSPDRLLQVEDFAGSWRRQTNIPGYVGAGFCTSNANGISRDKMRTTLVTDAAGEYSVWVRAYQSESTFTKDRQRGLRVTLAGTPLDPTHTGGEVGWLWQRAGAVHLTEGAVELVVSDAAPGYESADALLVTAATYTAGELDELYDRAALDYFNGQSDFYAWLCRHSVDQFDQRRKAVAMAKTSREAAEARRDELLVAYRDLIGPLPERTPLKAVVTGTITEPDLVIDKVHYESRPDHHVTANLYLPRGAGPFPGVLVACGHATEESKAYPEYQRVARLLAANGFAALVYDPIAQGERYQPEFQDQGTNAHELLSYGALLTGTSVVAHEAWDGMRSLDYLLSRPEVDKQAKVGLTGNSGGGTQTAFLMALDERIDVAAPSCYVMTRERLFTTIDPQDGCQHLPGEGALGIEHADYLAMRAPKPTLILAAKRDFFEFEATATAFREAQEFFSALGAAECVGLATTNDEHGYNRELREAGVRWMKRWILGDDTPVSEPEFEVLSAAALQVTVSGQVSEEFETERTVADLNRERARTLAEERVEQADLGTAVREFLKISAPARANMVTPREITRAGYTLQKQFAVVGQYAMPALLATPPARLRPGPVLILDSRGKAAEAMPGGLLDELARAGHTVLSIDLRGYGETHDRNFSRYKNDEQRTAAVARHIGRPLLAQRVRDGLAALAYLREIDDRPAHIYGIGLAGPIALHVAALTPDVTELTLRDSIESWQFDVVERPADPQLSALVMPGALALYDLPDLAALIAARN
jgi:dienelactone hydrolase